MYWSGGEVPTNFIIYENQRPFTEPKNNEYWDSYAVEASSYALMENGRASCRERV